MVTLKKIMVLALLCSCIVSYILVSRQLSQYMPTHSEKMREIPWSARSVPAEVCPLFSSQDTRTAAMCIIAKLEEPYVAEFVNYNLGIGFTTVYIYDNSDEFLLRQWGQEKQKQFLKCGNPNGGVQIVHWPGDRQQISAFNDCARRAASSANGSILAQSRNTSGPIYTVQNHTWAAFYDGDEYLVLKKHDHVVDFLAEHLGSDRTTSVEGKKTKVGALAITWQNMDSTFSIGQDQLEAGKTAEVHPRISYAPIPLTKRFQFRASVLDTSGKDFVKLIVLLDRVDWTNEKQSPFEDTMHKVGAMQDGSVAIRTDGRACGSKGNLRDVAALYHFHTKSNYEYVVKRKRGSAIRKDLFTERLRVAEELLQEALTNVQEQNSAFRISEFDDAAWKAMKKYVPVYAVYDDLARIIPS